MLSETEEKKQYFNTYWDTRDIGSADARSIQRADFVQSLLRPDKGEKIIDVGCGRGTVLRYLTKIGFTITGCDISSNTVAQLMDLGYEAFLYDIENDVLPGKYDVILCLEVLQQIFDPAKVLRDFKAHLYPGGCIIVSVPNEFHLLSRLKLLFGKSHLGHFEESHIRLFSPNRARELFESCGFAIDAVIPVSVVPPKMGILQGIGGLLAKIWPGLFSLSQIYRLKIQ